MPKQVDHHERRTRIADALLRVAADRGVEAVSLRHVAAEAGVSTGMVQHYFRTKDEMVDFALEAVSERTRSRLAGEIADLGPAPAPEVFLRALLVQQLPFDETRRIEGRVALAFYAYTARNSAIAAKLDADTAQLADYVGNLIRAAQTAAEVPAHLDPVHTAAALLALVEGLGVRAATGYQAPEDALAVLDAHLTAVFAPATRL
ncbi:MULTISPECIES: TetR/AcrR family transcriptional regulator [Nocardia]|uniref:TetR/AcrR family transcriptional regulator n=1 Tax=Nocardia TaxID=1817 RepID=UPI001894E049|nr:MULTISPECIES: TetR family transcriptional regulator C-terminal domain-containing protein [Nocardia]MBF6347667.1 TetR family transcriptional regulator C-terminal domain-containing protein [Nocardia flavorosea]